MMKEAPELRTRKAQWNPVYWVRGLRHTGAVTFQQAGNPKGKKVGMGILKIRNVVSIFGKICFIPCIVIAGLVGCDTSIGEDPEPGHLGDSFTLPGGMIENWSAQQPVTVTSAPFEGITFTIGPDGRIPDNITVEVPDEEYLGSEHFDSKNFADARWAVIRVLEDSDGVSVIRKALPFTFIEWVYVDQDTVGNDRFEGLELKRGWNQVIEISDGENGEFKIGDEPRGTRWENLSER